MTTKKTAKKTTTKKVVATITPAPADDLQVRATQLAGQTQAFDVIGKICTVATFKAMAEIKQAKAYKGLRLIGPDGKVETVTTFDKYCRLTVSRSADHINQGILNLAEFGEQSFEAMTRIGLGYRDMRQVRKLPKDQQLKIQEQIIDVGNTSEVKDLIAELVLETAAAQAETTDLEGALAKKVTQTEKLAAQVSTLKKASKITGELEPIAELVEMAHTRSTSWADRTLDAMNRFELVIDTLANPELYGLDGDNQADHAAYSMAANAVAMNLFSILARAQQLTEKLQEAAGEHINYEPGEGPVLTSAQIDSINLARETMLSAHDSQAAIDDNAVADKTNKRGRRKAVKK